MIKLIIVLIIVFILGLFCGVFLNALCYNSKVSEEIYTDVISKLESENNNLNKENSNE